MSKRKLTIGCVLVVVGGNGLGGCGGSIEDGPSDETTQDGMVGSGGAGVGGWVGTIATGGVGSTGGAIFIGVPADGGGFVGDIGIIYPGTGGYTGSGGESNLGGMGGEAVDEE